MDLWVAIEDDAGTVRVLNNTGMNQAESVSSFPVVEGRVYTITISSLNRARGTGQLSLDFAPDGAGTGQHVVNSTVREDQTLPQVAMNALGRTVVVWRSFQSNEDHDIWAQIYTENGSPLGTEFRINNLDTFVEQDLPRVAMAADGTFWVAWIDQSLSRVKARRFSSTGQALTGEVDTVWRFPSCRWLSKTMAPPWS